MQLLKLAKYEKVTSEKLTKVLQMILISIVSLNIAFENNSDLHSKVAKENGDSNVAPPKSTSSLNIHPIKSDWFSKEAFLKETDESNMSWVKIEKSGKIELSNLIGSVTFTYDIVVSILIVGIEPASFLK